MRIAGWPTLGVMALWAFSCSDTSPSFRQNNSASNAADAAAGRSTSSAGSPSTALQDDTTGVLGIGTGDAAFVPMIGKDNACLSEVREAERVDVDLFVMLDRSGSMLASTGTVSKWDAVTSALTTFLQNPDTANIGVGLRVFPQLHPDTPDECFNDADCGDRGPCSIPGVCPDDTFCTSDTGCVHPNDPTRTGYCANANQFSCTPGTNCMGNRGECLALECTNGYCADDPGYVCFEGTSCVAGNTNLGACLPQPGYCLFADSCEAGAYATPDVPITLGATRNADIEAALLATDPTGLTPTAPALQGAIEYASSWSVQNPSRAAAVVLATDGFPSECLADSTDAVSPVRLVAQAGVALAPSIRTYVIGVFSAQEGLDGASDILDSMAQSGGTGSAFLVDTTGNVSDEFLTALQTISANAITCEFQLPADDDLDYGAVNLLLTQADDSQVQLINVDSPAGCASDGDIGWYYVNDPVTDIPTQISVCPGVCQQFLALGSSGHVDLQIGCETLIR